MGECNAACNSPRSAGISTFMTRPAPCWEDIIEQQVSSVTCLPSHVPRTCEARHDMTPLCCCSLCKPTRGDDDLQLPRPQLNSSPAQHNPAAQSVYHYHSRSTRYFILHAYHDRSAKLALGWLYGFFLKNCFTTRQHTHYGLSILFVHEGVFAFELWCA